jgi:CRP-like cAMP-binding protein
VRENLALKRLSPETSRELAPFLHHRQFSRGETLFVSGNQVRHLFFMQSGAASLVTQLAEGAAIEFAIVGRDSIVGGAAAMGSPQAFYKASIQVAGEGYSLDRKVARQFALKYEEFRLLINRHEQFILAQSQQSSACNALHNVDQRLARWLLRLRDATNSDTLEVTQELASHMIGVRRTTISLAAAKFQHMGWISYARGHLNLEKVEALEHCACECHLAIRGHYADLLTAENTHQHPND